MTNKRKLTKKTKPSKNIFEDVVVTNDDNDRFVLAMSKCWIEMSDENRTALFDTFYGKYPLTNVCDTERPLFVKALGNVGNNVYEYRHILFWGQRIVTAEFFAIDHNKLVFEFSDVHMPIQKKWITPWHHKTCELAFDADSVKNVQRVCKHFDRNFTLGEDPEYGPDDMLLVKNAEPDLTAGFRSHSDYVHYRNWEDWTGIFEIMQVWGYEVRFR
jgi:hypothetical protein